MAEAAAKRVPDARLRAILDRLDVGLVVRRMELAYSAIPAYTNFAWDDSAGERRSVLRWNVELILRWMANGIPPDQYVLSELHELVRLRAIAGLPVEDGVRVYRTGARVLWDSLLDLVSDEDRPVLVEQSEVVWSYLDLVVETFASAYADQGDSPSTVGNRRAGALFERLCSELPITVEDQDRAARLGFDLSAPYCPFAAVLDGASVTAHADLASRLRAAGALASAEGLRVVGLTGPGFDWSAFLKDGRLVLVQDPPTSRLRLGQVTDTLRALTAIATRSGRRGRVSSDDFLPQLLLANSADLADRLVQRVFGPLEGNADLTSTLRNLAARAFDRTATAAALPVHRNTLLYRIGRIEEATGLDLQQYDDRELIRLAVMWMDISPLIRSALG
jgi:hypothetical protein